MERMRREPVARDGREMSNRPETRRVTKVQMLCLSRASQRRQVKIDRQIFALYKAKGTQTFTIHDSQNHEFFSKLAFLVLARELVRMFFGPV